MIFGNSLYIHVKGSGVATRAASFVVLIFMDVYSIDLWWRYQSDLEVSTFPFVCLLFGKIDRIQCINLTVIGWLDCNWPLNLNFGGHKLNYSGSMWRCDLWSTDRLHVGIQVTYPKVVYIPEGMLTLRQWDSIKFNNIVIFKASLTWHGNDLFELWPKWQKYKCWIVISNGENLILS